MGLVGKVTSATSVRSSMNTMALDVCTATDKAIRMSVAYLTKQMVPRERKERGEQSARVMKKRSEELDRRMRERETSEAIKERLGKSVIETRDEVTKVLQE